MLAWIPIDPGYNDDDVELKRLEEELRRAQQEAEKREIERKLRELRGGLYV